MRLPTPTLSLAPLARTAEDAGRVFAPVWVSTLLHLTRYRAIVYTTPAPARLARRYDVPGDCPCAQPLGLSWMRAPVQFLAIGTLRLHDDALELEPRRPWPGPARLHNVRDDLAFRVPRRHVLGAEPYRYVSPLGPAHDRLWVRVRSVVDGIAGDVLLTPGDTPLLPSSPERRAGRERALVDAVLAACVGEGHPARA